VNTKVAYKAVIGMFNQTLDVGREFGGQNKPDNEDEDFEAQFPAGSTSQ
jgi:hypothetical protein